MGLDSCKLQPKQIAQLSTKIRKTMFEYTIYGKKI